MANVRQTNQIREQAPRQGGLLGTLFNVLSMIPIPEAQLAGQIGGAFLNPTGSNLGGVVSQTAKMVGGGDGTLEDLTSDAIDGMDTMVDEPEKEHNAKEEATELSAVPVGGDTPDPVSMDSSEEKNKEEGGDKSLDLYANMTMDEVFKKHPQLQNMFSEYLFQA